VTEATFKDVIMEDDSEAVLDISGNDTNEDAFLYFACLSNHYLPLVKSSSLAPNTVSCHMMMFLVIADK